MQQHAASIGPRKDGGGGGGAGGWREIIAMSLNNWPIPLSTVSAFQGPDWNPAGHLALTCENLTWGK